MISGAVVEKLGGVPIEKQKVEIVERKGRGHPDFMADSIAEVYSRNLSRYYIKEFGDILHHNVDKLEIIGGMAEPAFGGGKVMIPSAILFSGRATDHYQGKAIPVKEIAVRSAKEWLSKNLRYVDSDSLRYVFETKSGAASLSNLYKRETILSNDTSFAVGYAPMSIVENTVMHLEELINSPEFKSRHPYTGEDVKVLICRRGSKLEITIACAFVDTHISSQEEYFSRKDELKDILTLELDRFLQENWSFNLVINGVDDRTQGIDGCYLTVTGTSSEHGDDGSVGRGNRVNGLITPNRLMSFEAIAGKNPVNHIGKIYNILSFKIAEEVNKALRKEVNVKMVGRIGDPIDQPQVIAVSLFPGPTREETAEVKRIAAEELASIGSITEGLVEGKFRIC